MNDLKITFSGEMWEVEEKGGWHFVTLPKDDAEQINFFTSGARIGFGSVKVTATIGDAVWDTSIFPDSKSESYLLPVKAEVRKKAKIQVGDVITVQLNIAV
jgi:hypothetical protein